MTTSHSVCSTQEAYALVAVMFAIDGILHLMAQNAQNQRLLRVFFTSLRPKSTIIVTAILKATV